MAGPFDFLFGGGDGSLDNANAPAVVNALQRTPPKGWTQEQEDAWFNRQTPTESQYWQSGETPQAQPSQNIQDSTQGTGWPSNVQTASVPSIGHFTGTPGDTAQASSQYQAGSGTGSVEATKRLVANTLSKAGWTPQMINVAMHNAQNESAFNYRNSHPDQDPLKYADPNSYGLWQYGGPNLPNVDKFMAQNYGGNRRDFLNNPEAQANFLVWDLKTNYPAIYAEMQRSSPARANELFIRGYLSPAQRFANYRSAQGYRGGIPDYSRYMEQAWPSQPPMSAQDLLKLAGN